MVEERPFATANPLNCSKCGIPATPEEKQEWDKANKNPTAKFLDLFGQEESHMTLICRKCIARRTRVKGFFDHVNDDEYWRDALYEEEWEWHAWRLTEDFEDESVLQVDLRRMLDEKLKVEDYNKIIEVLTRMMLAYKYSGDASMGDKR